MPKILAGQTAILAKKVIIKLNKSGFFKVVLKGRHFYAVHIYIHKNRGRERQTQKIIEGFPYN